MADDLDKRIKQIADMFGVSDTKSLKNIVENISSNSAPGNENASSESTAAEDEDNAVPTFNQSYGGGRNNTMELLSKANEMVNMFNNISDSRIALLHSVQPFLRPQRQQRLNGAVQLLKIISVISTITNNRNTKG